MNRRLVLLNSVLLAVTVLGAFSLRHQWRDTRERERTVLERKVAPVPPPPVSPLAQPRPVQAAGFTEIAEKALFFKDRNSTVVVEVAPPPPPKPMPPLPVLHGVLNLGDGVAAILSETRNAPHRDYRPGDQVGEFKLVSVNSQRIVLDWEGKQIERNVEELIDRTASAPAQAAESQAAAPPAAAPAQPKVPVSGPGVDIGKSMRACQAGDTSPVGAVVDGLRKVTWDTPFGQGCRWEPVQ